MSFFKKIFVVLAMIGLMIPSFAFAAFGLEDAAKGTGLLKPQSGVSAQDAIPVLIGNIVGVALSFLGAIFFLLILYAGFLWMTAFGSSEKADKAKSILEHAAVGLVIVLAAYAISRFVFSALEVGGGSTGGSTPTPTASPVAGQSCGDGDNRVWNASGACTTECEYQYPSSGCGEYSVCAELQATIPSVQAKVDLCPNDKVCCVI